MKHHDDIEGLFGKSEHNLEEMPSKGVWNRLEQKLDKPKPKKSPGVFRYLLVAASVMLLVAAIPLISNLVGKKASQEMAMAKAMVPSYLEDLQINTDTSNDYYRVVEYQRKHKDRMSNPIAEGQKGRKLYVTKSLQDFSDVAAIEKPLPQKSKKEKLKESKPTKIQVVKTTSPKDFNIEIGTGTIQEVAAESGGDMSGAEELETASTDDRVSEETSAVNFVLEKPVATRAVDVVAYTEEMALESSAADVPVATEILTQDVVASDGEIMDNEEADYTNEPVQNFGASRISRSGKSKKRQGAKKETTKDLDNIVDGGKVKVRTRGIQQFQWLTGTWKSKDGFSRETWVQTDPKNLVGTGVFIHEGTTLFAETFFLEEIEGNIFYTMKINDTGKTARFVLKKYGKNKAVFESVKHGAAESLVLAKTTFGKLTVKLKLQKSMLSDDAIRRYLEQRNSIYDNKVVRDLIKE